MLRRTFQHIPGVGPWREKDLWARGIRTWDDFPTGDEVDVAISRKADPLARERIALASDALARRDLAALAKLIPEREHWRLYGAFPERAMFFDIETDGRTTQKPTVVSVFDAQGLHVFIEGRNMEALPETMERSAVWVSFNGTCYDVPVLQRFFPKLKAPLAHLDLRFLCHRLELRGGLKRVEDTFGISRPLHLRGVNGYDAVVLWRAYEQRGDLEALQYLVEYNLYDSINLRGLLDRMYNRIIIEDLALDAPTLPVHERGDILYDVSTLVLALSPTERDLRALERIRDQDRELGQDLDSAG